MRNWTMRPSSADAAMPGGASLPVTLLVIFVGALLLLWPAAYNGFPIAFYDTSQYLSGGQKALAAIGIGTGEAQAPPIADVSAGPAAAGTAAEGTAADAAAAGTAADAADSEQGARDDRSVYYGLFAQLLNLIGGFPAIVAMQAALTAVALVRGMHIVGVRSAPRQLLILALLAAFTPLSFFVSLVMPDIFGPLMLLGLAVVAAYHRQLAWPETMLWLGLVLMGVLFHKAFLLTAVVIVVATLVLRLITPPYTAAMARLAAPIALGVAGTIMIGAAVEQVLDRRVVHTPFLLARLVEDGTAETILREDCPQAGYRTCIYLPELPMSENEFLWGNTTRGVRGEASSGFMGLALEDRLEIAAEQRVILMEVLRRYPLEQLARSTENVARSLVTLSLRRFQPPDEGEKELASKQQFYNGSLRAMPVAMPKLAASKLWREEFPLGGISFVSTATYLPSLLLLGLFLAAHLRKPLGRDGAPDVRFVRLVAIVVLGLLVNAAVSGVISGVSGRYQARFAALAPFVMLALLARTQSRNEPVITKAARADQLDESVA